MPKTSICERVRWRGDNRAQKEELPFREDVVTNSPVQHFPKWPKSALLWEAVVSSERNCYVIWAASSRNLLDLGKWCLEMLESLGHWCLVTWWELRAGNCYMSWSFSSLLCFTEEVSGSPKMHHFWNLKRWFQENLCVSVSPRWLGQGPEWFTSEVPLLQNLGAHVLQALQDPQFQVALQVVALHIMQGCEVDWYRFLLNLGGCWRCRERKEENTKRKEIVKKWQLKAPGDMERRFKTGEDSITILFGV